MSKALWIFPYRMSVHFVFTCFNEDMSWTDGLEKRFIYNKGPKDIPNQYKRIPNVGRDAETIFNYIIEFYDNLPDVVVFSQAKLWDHFGFDPEDKISPKKLMIEFARSAYENGLSSNFRIQCNEDPNWTLDQQKFESQGHYLELFKPDYPRLNGVFKTFPQWFREIFGAEFPNPSYGCWNVTFGVRKDLILKNSKEFYQEMIKHLNYDENVIEIHFFERSYYYLFNRELLD